MVQLESVRASTGETILVPERADVALKELDESLVRYQQLRTCLAS